MCWGTNASSQTAAKIGKYSDVAAGAVHSCGLRTDATIVCWGDNGNGQTDAPEGEFTAIAGGDRHSCAMRTDTTITCWGANASGQTDAPEGAFSAVAGGLWYSCGLRSDGTATCWGDNTFGQATAPDGEFTAVTGGFWHSCGLRSDATIACWGDDRRPTNVPAARFGALSSGAEHACGVRTDATITCWGNNTSGRSGAPDGQFDVVSAGTWHTCGVRTDATITCWGENSYAQTDAPDGQYSAVSAGWLYSCGLRTDATIVCWGDNAHGQTEAPDGQFTAVAAGGTSSCGLRSDATVVCWGDDTYGQGDAPEGSFTVIAVADGHSCGVRSDATIACWGGNWNGQSDAPDGHFSNVSAGTRHSCGLRSDATIACWGGNWNGQSDAPDGHFSNVSAGTRHSCGLRSDGTIACWGDDGRLVDPPGGNFSTVTTGDRHACGLRADGTATCWELAPVVPAPDGVQLVSLADPSACRPYGVHHDVTAGFPPPANAVDAIGTVRIGVLFLDFPDAAAAHSTRREAELSLPGTEQYLEAVSYGQLDVEFVPLHGWLRAEHDHDHYLTESTIEGQQSLDAIDEVAVRLADPDFDFSGLSSVMIVMPSSHFGGGDAGWRLDTEEGVVPTFVRINAFPYEEPLDLPLPWAVLAYHELVHNLGLVDYYPYEILELPDPPSGKTWVGGHFGPMGLSALFLADERDARLAHIVHHPNGARSTQFTPAFGAREMLAWSRWQLGWLDEAQVSCVTEVEATVILTPVAAPGDGIAMVAIPLSDTEVVVVESRREIGYDAKREFRWADGGHTRFPALAAEGVLVYTVDAARPSGRLPLRIVAETSTPQIRGLPILTDDYPILTEGQSITIRGYTITVESATDETHTVAITKTAAVAEPTADTESVEGPEPVADADPAAAEDA